MIISAERNGLCEVYNMQVSYRKLTMVRELMTGASRFEDAASYLARYELYDEAFRLYKGDHERLPVSKAFHCN
jgi:hypothetical protein